MADDILTERYCQHGEKPEDVFKRVAQYYGNNEAHSKRLLEYFEKKWLIPSTPILSNGGTEKGLPISCFLNEVEDSMADILNRQTECGHLASLGGGIGTYYGNIRSINEPIKNGKKGKTTGVIPFIKTLDSQTLAVSQGSNRRGSAAVYMQISHPEIEEFIDIRRPTSRDIHRQSQNIHHGVVISDEFMQKAQNNEDFELKSPHDGKIISTVNARNLWYKILTTRAETGEPYIVFGDTVNNARPVVYKKLGLEVKTSNLCAEIMLTTGEDYREKKRTAVCCLSSVNLEFFPEWKDSPFFIKDALYLLDNVLSDFITKAPKSIARAAYSAHMERSVGLGVMGFHSLLQKQNIAFEWIAAKVKNIEIFKHIKNACDKANYEIAIERGACPDCEKVGEVKRFSHCTAIAPTASISIFAHTSPSIEPYSANLITQKTLSGTFIVKNKHLEALLQKIGQNDDVVWASIARNKGSVQHLSFLTDEEKDIFKTAQEINPLYIIDYASERQPYVDQGQSVNIFVKHNILKSDLHAIHYRAWKKKLKSLYYCRSESAHEASTKSEISVQPKPFELDECLACQ